MSPLTITGTCTASFTRRTNPQSASPRYSWHRVRPWTAIIATPRSSAIRASSGALRLAWSQPMRILSVTGTSTALTVAAISAVASGRSRISADPAWPLTTFLTGHPMLMSMIAAPRSALSFAASAITRGSHPASCIDTGSSAASQAHFCSDCASRGPSPRTRSSR